MIAFGDRRCKCAAGDLERVARAHLVDRQPGEGGHPLAGRHRERAAWSFAPVGLLSMTATFTAALLAEVATLP